MKKLLLNLGFIIPFLITNSLYAQIQKVFTNSGNVGTISGTPDNLRVTDGWSSHYVSGTMGGFKL